MRKWKRDYRSPQKTKNKLNWKRDDGMTLVELIASIAILLVVILLVGSVHIFGQRQFINQTESASQANDLSYSLSVMSRDLRKASYGSVTLNDSKNIITIDGVETFIHSGNTLKKGATVLSTRVGSVDFSLSSEEGENSITIILYSTGNQQNQSNDYQTTIYFRR